MNYKTKKIFSKYIIFFLLLTIIISLSACGKKTSSADSSTHNNVDSSIPANAKNPVATIEMADGAKIEIELYPKIAPNTVRNFISLANKGFYDGLTFHRVIPGFMIQGGDPTGDGTGGPGYSIKGEFKSNGFSNTLKHTKGIISMARTNNPNSAGSQFFIMVAAASNLDGDYAAFGKVTQGMDEINKIVSVRTGANDKPTSPQKMKKVSVDTFGFDFGEVKTAK